MTPGFAFYDVENHVGMAIKHLSQVFGIAAFYIVFSNVKNILLRKSTASVKFTRCSTMSTFVITVLTVLLGSSCKQMRRIYASRIVAMMTNKMSRRNSVSSTLESKAVRTHSGSVIPESPVSITVMMPVIDPATRSLGYTGLESQKVRISHKGIITWH